MTTPGIERTVRFRNRRGQELVADWRRPAGPARTPVVVVAHGWGSGRTSPRNVAIARALLAAGVGSFLPDLTGHGESQGDREATALEDHVHDVLDALALLARESSAGPIGLAGSSSGGAVALAAAAADPRVAALVLRAPSADARATNAARVVAPTLVLQGEHDPLLERNLRLAEQLAGEHRLVVVPGAGHLFEEPGASERVTEETVRWFRRWLLGERLEAGGQAARREAARALEPAPTHFVDRAAAGRALAPRLEHLRAADPVVLALPRGGIEVAEPIARALGADLDVFVVRKVRTPMQPELALGAVAEGGVVVWNPDVVPFVDERARRRELERARRELDERVAEYRAVTPRVPLTGRTVIVTDDGVATGSTLEAAVQALRALGVGRLVVALPGGPDDTLRRFRSMPGVDELVALAVPPNFYAVGQLYDRFEQVESAAVCGALRRQRARRVIDRGERGEPPGQQRPPESDGTSRP